MRKILILAVALFSVALIAQTNTTDWVAVGPDGGDVRSLAYDPQHPDHIFAGSATGEIFLSEDFGQHWSRLARVAGPTATDYVIDHILIDPSSGTLYVAVWSLLRESGGIYRSTDGGHTWASLAGMQGKSVRSFAMSPSDPKIMVAGALDGVFRTADAGATWERISPPNYAEIKNVESVAIDPANPEVIYAGTWHLPWKTVDGGKTWHNIHNGVVDDSDVFSIIVDPKQPAVVYASACSGIYRSDNGGELFRKAQGIPFTARRTRVLQQDALNRDTVFAGTTEGLWRTSNGGRAWRQLTPPNTIINDVLIDPRNSSRVLIATDRGGILASSDGGTTFRPSNTGYSQRIVSALVLSSKSPGTIYAGLIKDKEDGGVFVSRDFGGHWEHINQGLGDRDVYVLQELPNGDLAAGTEDGIYLHSNGAPWHRIGEIPTETQTTVPGRRLKSGKRAPAKTSSRTRRVPFSFRVHALQHAGTEWLAATSAGLYRSEDDLKNWAQVPSDGITEVLAVTKSKDDFVIAGRGSIRVSNDDGKTWHDPKLPNVSSIVSLSDSPDGELWVAAREGAFHSKDHGATWAYAWNLPAKPITSLGWVDGSHSIVASGANATTLYESADGSTWSAVPAGWLIRSMVSRDGKTVAATAFDGVVIPAPK
ncbi:MAG: exo-alpha-sialidase [Acidobacteriaceae bacterium]